MHAIFSLLAENQVLLLFILVGAGMALGHLKIRGIGLGAAAVLFIAIAVSAWGLTYGAELKVAHDIGVLGLALFAFAIGVNSGPNFFHMMRTAGGPILGMLAVLIAAGGAAYAVGSALGMEVPLIAGTFAGAITNTPALASAGAASGQPDLATVGYSISYLFGVIGMLVFAQLALNYGKRDKDTPSPIANRTIRVERDDRPAIADLQRVLGTSLQFSRLRRGEVGPITTPMPTDVLYRDDLITVVGPQEDLDKAIAELGHGSSHSLLADRRYLDFRRITVSDPKLAGHQIHELNLEEKFSATVSRVRRGDVDMVGTPDLVLQLGDRVRVVAPTSKMKGISKYFGDSARGLSDINPIALGLGMALGILIGETPIMLPGGSTFSIGAAAGTLIVGLVMGKIGRIGKVVTAIPYTACQVLSEFGLLVFLAYAGTAAGGQIANAFTGGSWWKIFVLGVVVTTIVGAGIYIVMRWVFKLGGTRTAGVLGGTQTQPAVLAYANTRTNTDPRVALGYAMVYPMAMIAKILIAHILGGL